jgi:hypothetical protein
MTIQERFERFNQQHPEVYRYLVQLARTAAQKGLRRYSMKALYNIARWHFWFERTGEEDYKLDDRYHSRYARLIMQNEPDLENFFELRRIRTA